MMKSIFLGNMVRIFLSQQKWLITIIEKVASLDFDRSVSIEAFSSLFINTFLAKLL